MSREIPNPRKLADFAETDAIRELLGGVARRGGNPSITQRPEPIPADARAPVMAFVGDETGAIISSELPPPLPTMIDQRPELISPSMKATEALPPLPAGSQFPPRSESEQNLPTKPQPIGALNFGELLTRINWRNRFGSGQAESPIGKPHGPSGTVACPLELVHALYRTIISECGFAAESILSRAGQVWGRLLSQRLTRDLACDHAMPLAEIPAARVGERLSTILAHCGWGSVKASFERHATGLIEIEAINAPLTFWTYRGAPVGDPLLANALADIFTAFGGLKLDCLQTESEVPGSAPARFVIGLPERLVQAADMARQGQPHERVVEFLESTQV